MRRFGIACPKERKSGEAPANFAYHVSQFGFDSRVVSAVGNDELGERFWKYSGRNS